MARTKPNYQYGSGAYGERRDLRENDGGGFTTEADIRAWRGSIEDVKRIAEEAVRAIQESNDRAAQQRFALTLSDGTQEQFDSPDDFERAARGAGPDQVTSVRIELVAHATNEEPSVSATVVMRREFPAVLMSVSGRDRIHVEGLGSLLFGSLMRGYVDALPSFWRPIVWFGSPLIPFLVATQVFNDEIDDLSVGWRIPIIAAFVVAGIWLFVKAYDWVSWKIPLEFVPDTAVSGPSVFERARELRSNAWVVRAVTLAGLVAIGVVTNKLSDLLPWP